MGRYTNFSLYWESWGGYADREAAFGFPTLVCVVASAENAAVCTVITDPKRLPDIGWSADWRRVPLEDVAHLRALLEEVAQAPVVTGAEGGDYLSVENLTGALHGHPFHVTFQYTMAAELTPLGRRLMTALAELRG